MSNKAANPSYDPSTPQHAKYLEGFHSVSEALVKGGIKPLKEVVDKPISGVAMTREEYQRQQAAADKFN